MAKLAPHVVLDSRNFEYDAKQRCMTAEASTCRFDHCQQIWNDAADVGIYIQSHRTSAVQGFVLADTVTSEGDVLAWKFTSIDPVLDLCVTIFND